MVTLPVILVLFFLIPLFLMLMSRLRLHNMHNYADRTIRAKRLISTNFISDFMRQFSEDFRQDHYMRFWLDRSNIFAADPAVYNFTGGRTKIKINNDIVGALDETTVRTNHIFVMNSQGAFTAGGTDFGGGVETVIAFRQTALRYALVSSGTLAVSAGHPLDGRTVTGGVWVGGDMSVAAGGASLSITSGPFVARGNVAVGGTLTLSAGTTFYYSPTAAVAGVTGGLQTAYLPPESAMDPGIYDLSYYETHYSTFVTVDSTWTFYKANGSNQCRFVNQTGGSFNVPVTSTFTPILVVKNANLTLRTVTGAPIAGWHRGLSQRFTIVNINGDVTIDGDWAYRDAANNTVVARSSPTYSVSVLTGGNLHFTSTGGGTSDVVGFHYVVGNTILEGNSHVHLRGALYTDSGLIGHTAAQGLTITADPNLWADMTPGIPERAVLVKQRPLR